MFYLINLMDFCYSILNLMPATSFKQVETGATKDWESSEMLQKHLFGGDGI